MLCLSVPSLMTIRPERTHRGQDWSGTGPLRAARRGSPPPAIYCDLCGGEIASSDPQAITEQLDRQAKAIAQALHDESGQLLTAAHLALSELSADVSESARRRIDDIRKYLDSIEEQLRRIAHEIRPRLLDDVGLNAALLFLAD